MAMTIYNGSSRCWGWRGNKAIRARQVASAALVFCVALVSACERKTADAADEKSAPVPADLWCEFSGEKAFAHVKAQCDIGPRPSSSAELETARRLIITELERSGWLVERQTFTDETPRGPVEFTNLIARYHGITSKTAAPSDRTQQFLVLSHYDTKHFDTIRFVGASDAASSTGALLELARVLALDPALARRVELVFFDGEEAFVQYTRNAAGQLTDGLHGSRHYAKTLVETKRAGQFVAGVLWDMIGHRELNITLPPDSPPPLLKAIFAAADQLKEFNARRVFSIADRPVLDDHTPLNDIGLPVIDLIGFDYPAWHTADDTLDKISPQSLQTIGAVTLRWLQNAAAAKQK